MHTALLEPSRLDLQLGRVRPHVTLGRRCRLSHHVAELTCKGESAPVREKARLDVEHFSTDRSPGQALSNARADFSPGFVGEESLPTQQRHQLLLGHRLKHRRSFSDPKRDLTYQLTNLAVELANSRLASVARNGLTQRVV